MTGPRAAVADAWGDNPTGCLVCGRDACEDHLPEAHPHRPPTSSLTFVRALDLIDQPPPATIVDGVAWAECVSVLVSESGTGKTFVLLDLAASVGAGSSWHGRSVQEGSVAYLSFEGDALGRRLKAARDARGHRLENVYILRASDPLSPRVTREGGESCSIGEVAILAALDELSSELAASGRPPIVLVIIDTVRASMAGSEDNSEHVSAYLRAVRRILRRTAGAAAILAHHAGWQDGKDRKKRERGSSAWRGNCDATLYLEAEEADGDGQTPLTLGALKVRDSERPAPFHLIRRRVDLDEADQYGQPVTSCVIERDRRSREDREGEASTAASAGQRVADMRVLKFIADRPDVATSQEKIRAALNQARHDIGASIARLVQGDWLALPEKQRLPYTVTAAGRHALAQGGSS